MPAQQLTQVCFTIHGVDAEFTLDPIFIERDAKYCVYQIEQGVEGAIHVQGYIELRKKMTLSAIKKVLDSEIAHIERRMGTRDQARDYCMKLESRIAGPYEIGEWSSAGQGRRCDLESAAALCREEGIDAVMEAMPGTYIRYRNNLRQYARDTAPKLRDTDFVPRPWQTKILDILSVPCTDNRHIHWVTDVTGNIGKTRLAKHMVSELGAITLSGALNDMKNGYLESDFPGIVIFNITRTQADHMDHLYSMAEMLKDGLFYSGKYVGGMCNFEAPHVIFFANCSWERSKITNDRMIEYRLEGQNLIVETFTI
jgi:hypothetical protein